MTASWVVRQFTPEADAIRDAAHGIRMLLKAPGFTSIALLVFATGIGAATVTSGREPGFLTAVRVSEHFFTVLGTAMVHGRAFLPHEFHQGAGRVAILSYPLWRDQFGSDASVIGRAVRLNDTEPYTVVGVTPPDLELRLYDTRSTQAEPLLWLPKQGFGQAESNNRGVGIWNVIGRLAPGVSVDEARAEFDGLSAQLAREYPQSNRNIAAQVVPLRVHLVGSLRHVLPLLLGCAALLLIVACANVANLLLARGVGRGREFALRQALGASRGRLVRQMLVETLVLAAVGGAAGLVLARWTLDVIAELRPLDVARIDQMPIDARAAVIACGVTIAAAVGLVLRDGLQLAGVGVIIGIIVALPLTRLLRSLLFGVTSVDAVTYLFVSVAVILVAAVACYLPARRALEVDPVNALRVD